MAIVARAPASMMLMGEHAVLYDYPALVAALDQWISVELIPRSDLTITIHSELGKHSAQIGSIQVVHPFQFVLESIKYYEAFLTRGFDLIICSEFSSTVGLGSSSAVTVATLLALQSFLGQALDKKELLEEGKQVVRTVQGQGSGADIGASVYGGLLRYHQQQTPLQLDVELPIHLVYSGYKTPTAQVIQKVREARQARPAFYDACFQSIGQTVDQAVAALQHGSMQVFEACVCDNQKLMVDLGVSDAGLQEILNVLLQIPNLGAAKISGSGLGDCVFALTEETIKLPEYLMLKGVREIPVQMTNLGAHLL